MSSDIAVSVQGLSKRFRIYNTPRDRLWEFVFGSLRRACHLPAKKYYEEFSAASDISFEIMQGETVGIIGRNGSGKSTLLQMICGTLTPTAGSVETHGRVGALLELGLGFNPEFSGVDNIFLNGQVLGLSRDEVSAIFEDIVEFADIGDFINQPVKTYSSGMFVRLAFAIQANINPCILVVDEALAVGDAYFVHRCMNRIKELQRGGTTVIFVSHDANTVRDFCSRVLWLEGGALKLDGDPSYVIDRYLSALFGIPDAPPADTTDTSIAEKETSPENGVNAPETVIKNMDRRLGDQLITIEGASLYDEELLPIAHSFNEKAVILRVTVRNNSQRHFEAPVIGYIFRDARGRELASTNTLEEEFELPNLAPNDLITLRMKVSLPCFHPGSYSFTPTAAYVERSGNIIVSDRIENAVVFDLLSEKKIHVLMRFATIFQMEL